MNFPEELKYSKDHEWIKIVDGIGYIGITDFAQSELGDIVFVDIPSVGQTVAAHEVFGAVEAVKTVSDLFMPVAGEIIEFNEAIEANPELVNEDPYEKGWIIKVKVTNENELNDLLSTADYKALIGV